MFVMPVQKASSSAASGVCLVSPLLLYSAPRLCCCCDVILFFLNKTSLTLPNCEFRFSMYSFLLCVAFVSSKCKKFND